MRFITYILFGAGAAIAIVALAVVLLDDGEQATIEPQTDGAGTSVAEAPQAPQTTPPASGQEAPAKAPPAAAETTEGQGVPQIPVQIDLAQVRPDGNAVFAGKAAPNAKITVFEGDVVLGTTTADENGEWVVVPEAALGPGEHLVSVGAVGGDGAETVADITMAIQVGETAEDSPLVALLPQSETDIPKLLQSPDDRPVATESVVAGKTPSSAEASASDPGIDSAAVIIPALAPRSLAWGAGGELVVTGVSRGGSSVAAAAAGAPFGTAGVRADGGWQISGRVSMDRPSRVMRFLLRDGAGKTVASYELPVATRDLSQGLDGSRMVIVQRGDALWRIAFQSYGEGVKYVDIVRRNAAAINDPDLIYPNQIFAIPQ